MFYHVKKYYNLKLQFIKLYTVEQEDVELDQSVLGLQNRILLLNPIDVKNCIIS